MKIIRNVPCLSTAHIRVTNVADVCMLIGTLAEFEFNSASRFNPMTPDLCHFRRIFFQVCKIIGGTFLFRRT